MQANKTTVDKGSGVCTIFQGCSRVRPELMGRVGSGHLTRPDRRNFRDVLIRSDPDLQDFEPPRTQPDPTCEVLKDDPTRLDP